MNVEITPFSAEFVDIGEDSYIRFGSDSWLQLYGESWESLYNCEKQEVAYKAAQSKVFDNSTKG